MPLIKETNLNFWSLSKQDKIKRIIIHHIGEPGWDVSAGEIHNWHLGYGWVGVGYHFVIRRGGGIERGRPEWAVGAHACGFNNGSLGVIFAGNMDVMEVSAAQIEAGAILLADLCTRYELEPNAQTIAGHCDLFATTCPGRNLYALLDTIRCKAIWYQQLAVQFKND